MDIILIRLTWLVLIGAVLCIWAQMRVNSTYKKFARVRSRSGLTGVQAAQRILQMSGIYDVRIEHVRGELTDHYDPSNKVLRLSDSVYGSDSIAAIGVAAHECGHAVQHDKGYTAVHQDGTCAGGKYRFKGGHSHYHSGSYTRYESGTDTRSVYGYLRWLCFFRW